MIRLSYYLLAGVLLLCLPLSSQDNMLPAKYTTEQLRLRNLPEINTERLEFSPTFYQNGMVYVSRKAQGPVDDKTGQTFYELFYSELDPNGLPSKPKLFSIELNSQHYEGPVSFNRAGTQIYFTRTNQHKGRKKAGKKGQNSLKIYKASRGTFDWEDVEELPFNGDDYNCLHPSLTPDDRRIYFASDMPGGFGGMDIYFADRTEDGWTTPINLGPQINTPENEVFPFYHVSGTLFFVSRGHRGFGGLDIFQVDLSGNRWGNIKNLGKPINSQADDLGFLLNDEGTRGYLSSDRPGGFGQDDIYMIEIPNGLEGLKLPEQVYTQVRVVSKKSSQRLKGAAIRIYERSNDGTVKDASIYDLALEPSRASSQELSLQLRRKAESKLPRPDYTSDRRGEATIRLVDKKRYLILVSKKGYRTQEIDYECSAVGFPLPIEVVMESLECVDLSVAVKRQGGGDIAGAFIRVSNDCDEPAAEGHTTVNGIYQECLPMGCEFIISAQKEGFQVGTATVSTAHARGSRSFTAEIILRPESEMSARRPVKEGTVIVMDNIFYDFNKSSIRTGAAQELELLARLMKAYPSMEIELGAHTDVRGGTDYNLRLSEDRAESAKIYLVNKGIASNRIRTAGYGERFPRNRCKDGVECSEEEHQFNRRTEVRILRIDEPLDDTIIPELYNQN